MSQLTAFPSMDDAAPQGETASPGEASKTLRAGIVAAALEGLIPNGSLKIQAKMGRERAAFLDTLYTNETYTDEKLADLCRLIALGLSEESAAQAIGIRLTTLRQWKRQIEGLGEAILRSKYMAIGAVSLILRGLMQSENEAVALRAVEFFLRTRSKEFREKQEIEIEFDAEKLQAKIRSELYGNFRNDTDEATHSEVAP